MDELRDLIEASRDASKKKDVMDAVNFLVEKNIDDVFMVLKNIFFHPLTNKEIRFFIGKIIASTKSKPTYNLLVSQLILRNFSDNAAIIYTIGEYKDPKIYDLLLREYPTCNFEAQLQVIEAIGKISSTKSIEFFSNVYNGELISKNLTPEQVQKIKEKAGDALQSQVMDI